MDISNVKKEDFIKFFTTDGMMPCIHAEFLLKGSLGVTDIVVTTNRTSSDTFFNRDKLKICNQEGVKIFADNEKYRALLGEFKTYIVKANETVVVKYKNYIEKISKEEIEEDLNFISKFWYLYGFTEFPYLDLAYQKAKGENNQMMMDNLDEFSRFKFKARELLNLYFFKNGVNENLLESVSRKFSIEAKFLFTDEILSLFDGKKVPEKLIEERPQCYSCAIIDGKIEVFSFKESLKINKEFVGDFQATNEIKGLTISKGLARGRAVVCTMVRSHDDIKKIDDVMEKGDILIAETTSPDTMVLCKKSAAIVAEQGGLLSHAAVVSREMGIPCVVQATNATRIIKTGDTVEVDANNGVVKIIR